MGKASIVFALVATMCWQVLAVSNQLDSFTHFTADVYREILKTETGNFAVSPISAQIVLSLASQGAKEKTAEELYTALHLPRDKNVIKQRFTALVSDLFGRNKSFISAANKMYLKKGYRLNQDFKKLAQDTFQVKVEKIDFLKEDSVGNINRWVEKQTQHKIKELVSQDDIDQYTTSLLINALYFQATWEYPFLADITEKKPFYVDGVTKKEADMMVQDEYFNFYASKQLDAQFLELPFAGSNATMTFVLPNQKDGLKTLEDSIEAVFSPQYDYKHRIDLAIPKFKIESTIQFKDIMEKLGVHKAFSEIAQFPDIVENKDLKLEKIVQKTFLDVQESGVTAAAATGVYWSEKSIPYASFIANHPFIYYIKVNNIIIFVGRYMSP